MYSVKGFFPPRKKLDSRSDLGSFCPAKQNKTQQKQHTKKTPPRPLYICDRMSPVTSWLLNVDLNPSGKHRVIFWCVIIMYYSRSRAPSPPLLHSSIPSPISGTAGPSGPPASNLESKRPFLDFFPPTAHVGSISKSCWGSLQNAPKSDQFFQHSHWHCWGHSKLGKMHEFLIGFSPFMNHLQRIPHAPTAIFCKDK